MIPPPTPTIAPTGVAKFVLDFTLWDAAPSAISYWHWASAAGVALQVVILIALIAFGTNIFIRWIREFTQKDAEE